MNQADSLIIDIHGLSKAYKGVEALKSLNLQVHPNSIFGFLGPNGAGKTTTIKLLLGLARPTAGSASVFEHDIAHDSVGIRKRVGYLAQDPRYYEYMTARETLRYTAHFFFKGPGKEIEARVANTLELVGLSDKLWNVSYNKRLTRPPSKRSLFARPSSIFLAMTPRFDACIIKTAKSGGKTWSTVS